MKAKARKHPILAISIVAALVLAMVAALAVQRGAVSEASGNPVMDRELLGLHVGKVLETMPVSERGWIRNHRVEVSWSDVETSRGVYKWTRLDELVNLVLSAGSESIMFLVGGPTPDWAQDPSYGEFARSAPPRDLNDWYLFCSAVAERYGSLVDFYEIWNEPGWDRDGQAYQYFRVFHFGGQVETDYLPLLQLAYAGIKEKDPTGVVMCGALMYSLEDDPDVGAENYALLFDDLNRPGQDVSVRVAADRPIVAERPMYFNYNGAWAGGHDSMGATTAQAEWLFAEGCTRPGFNTYLCLQNPGAAAAAVTVYYYCGDGTNEQRTLTVPAQSRFTIPVHDAGLGIGVWDSARGDVSIKVVSSQPIVAERPMYFNYAGAWAGGHDAMGATAAQAEWLFAEGCTRPGFNTWLCLQNPGAADAAVTIDYYCGDGTNERRTLTVPARRRSTVPVHDAVLGIGAWDSARGDVSIKVTSSQPIVAERPMYFNYAGAWAGGHDAMGATAAQAEWLFAEGCTRTGFNTYLCLQNPGTANATVNIDYYCGDGFNLRRTVTVRARSRYTVPVHGPDPGLGTYDSARGDVSIKVTSSQPIVAERPMYFNFNGTWAGGHDAMGTTSAQAEWLFAEGCTGFSIEEYICLQNPNDHAAVADLTFMMSRGETFTRRVTLAPLSRTTLDINRLIGFNGSCDLIALHPYKSYFYWGPFYTTVVNAVRSRGAWQEVAATEIGWPHYSDGQPAEFSEAGQATALRDGIQGLFDNGCKKIWVYRDVDEPPGTAWDGNYYGLFSSTGVPHAAWYSYAYWQQQIPDYPLLPTSWTWP
ncbi:MAG: DUF5719 family protein [Actinomycetota bacterium]